MTTPLFFLNMKRAVSNNNAHGVTDNFSYQSLQSQVLAIVMGNMLSLLLLLIIYFNIQIFGHYGSEMIYAALISEALFSSRVRLVGALKRYTSPDTDFSPRNMVFSTFSTLRGALMLGALLGLLRGLVFSSLIEPVLLLLSTCWFMALGDRHALFLFRIHHALRISDETLVSLFICFFLLASLFVFLGSFLVLALQDMSLAVDNFATWADLLEDEAVRSKLNETLGLGRNHIDSIASSLSEQYESTPYRVAIRLTADLLSNMTRKLERAPEDAPVFSLLLDQVFDDNLKDQILSLSLSALYNSSDVILPQAANVLFSPLYLALWFFLGMGAAFLDFGIRASFFAGLLVFLVAHPKSILHSVMESLLSVFQRAAKSKQLRRRSSSAHANSNSFVSGGDDVSLDASAIDIGWEGEEELNAKTALAFQRFEEELRHTFKAVFLVPISLAAANALATLAVFSFFNLVFAANLNLSYFAALVSLFLTLIPLVSPFASCLPWVAVCGFVHQRHWVAFALLLSHFILFQWIDSKMVSAFHPTSNVPHYREKKDDFRAYLTGLSFFFGITSMGMHGIVLGPLLVSFLYTLMHFVLDQYRDAIHTRFEF